MCTYNDLSASLINRIATFSAPIDIQALRSTSIKNSIIPEKIITDAKTNLLLNSNATQAKMDKNTHSGNKRGSKLTDEITENSVFRILWLASQANCRYWWDMSEIERKKFQDFFGFSETPDFIYYGVPTDAFSVKSSLLERRDNDAVKASLFHTLSTKIHEKWGKYGGSTIAVADISTWPQFIRTHHAAQHVIKQCVPIETQKVFLIRARPGSRTKLMRIFDH